MANLGRNRISRTEARSWVALAAVVGLVLGVFAGPVLAAGSPAAPNLITADGTANEHTISVSGTGITRVAPDVADVSLGVQVQKQSAAAARDEAASKMSAIIAALRSLGIAEADIQTSWIDVSPTYDYNVSTPRVTGYQVSNQVNVHVRDLSLLASVIDDSVAAGANSVSGISFDLADRSAAENQAREAAVKDARARADTLAAAADVTIAGVASISESYSSPWPYYSAAPGRELAGDVATPVQPGTSEITITVSISYLIG